MRLRGHVFKKCHESRPDPVCYFQTVPKPLLAQTGLVCVLNICASEIKAIRLLNVARVFCALSDIETTWYSAKIKAYNYEQHIVNPHPCTKSNIIREFFSFFFFVEMWTGPMGTFSSSIFFF